MGYKDPEKAKQKRREYYLKNKEREKEKRREYYLENMEKEKAYSRQYNKDNNVEVLEKKRESYHNNREENLEKMREYARTHKVERKLRDSKNREHMNERQRERIATDMEFRLKHVLRVRLNKALNGLDKSAKTMELLGCTVEELKAHIESQFTEGMSWDNYGHTGFHIDHIKPCSSFDLTDPAQQNECFNYKNLQPLWAIDNLSKGSSY